MKKRVDFKFIEMVCLFLLVDAEKNVLHKNKKKIADETGKVIIQEGIETSSLAFRRGTTPPVQRRTLTFEERIEELREDK